MHIIKMGDIEITISQREYNTSFVLCVKTKKFFDFSNFYNLRFKFIQLDI